MIIVLVWLVRHKKITFLKKCQCLRLYASIEAKRILAVRIGRVRGYGLDCRCTERREFIFVRMLAGVSDAGKKSAMATSRAFAKKIKSQSLIRFCVVSIWATAVRSTFQPR
jgi:hypothetical protein